MADKVVLQKFKEKPSARKVLATIFWDRKDVLLLEYCPKDSNMTSDTLIRLQKAIKSKHPGLLKQKVILMHDNATPHLAKLTQSLLNQLKWDVFLHLAYSLDLPPSNYHLIPSQKRDLGGRHFAMEEDLQCVVVEFFVKQDTEWYCVGIYKLISRYNKCLDERSDYVEK